jgi:pimeloyl-ACP methyl ester carboxylesterase
VALTVACLALAGCGGAKHQATQTASTTTVATDWTSAGRDSSGTVWLCRPGLADNPCETSLEATVEGLNGQTHVERAQGAKNPTVDCFYLYPTVSSQPTANANLEIGLRERLVATAQASRFSQVCRVYAPMYRQVTLATIDRPGGINAKDSIVAYRSALAAFRDYLAHYNAGRGIIFIGHSQGASILIALLQREVDPKPKVRRLLVSALLMGGNVTVPRGRNVGGDFAHIPACRSRGQTGCVVAYSSYSAKPPLNSQYGRVRTAVNPLGTPRAAGLQVLCVNPAAPSGGTAPLDPYYPAITLAFLQRQTGTPTAVSTPWVAFPGEYTARCERSGGATWLQVTRVPSMGDRRPALTNGQGGVLGLHVFDVNLALGNLVSLARAEVGAYRD